jgi:DNA (cytosine-5)-methyltransferase 1
VDVSQADLPAAVTAWADEWYSRESNQSEHAAFAMGSLRDSEKFADDIVRAFADDIRMSGIGPDATRLAEMGGWRMDTQPFSVVSLFSGAGGLDIGLEAAGFHTVSTLDCDPDCVASLCANQRLGVPTGNGRNHLQGTRLLGADIEKVNAEHLRPVGAGRRWTPDLMAGGPPCQPFSSSGKMLSVEDPRGKLFQHFVRLADALQPRLILFENVRGLVTARGTRGEPGEVLDMVKDAFEGIGYATTFALLNAADFGAAQRRVRCFMMATRATALPAFPEPTHAETPSGGLFDRRSPWVTLRELLATLPPPSADEIIWPTPRLSAELGSVPCGSGLKSAGARESTRPGGHWGYRQGTFIADLDQPARTVTASASQDWIRAPDGQLRRLTLRECAALQGFPREWSFAGPVASRYRQVGNAVPIMFGRTLGESMLSVLRQGQQPKPVSAPLPREFGSAIEYTRREHRRNGDSRKVARLKIQQVGVDVQEVKGLGSMDWVIGKR